MKILVITDCNDADYVEHLYRDITEETLEKFMPLINAIADAKPYPYKLGIAIHNFPVGDYVRTDLYEKTVYEMYNQFSKEYIDEFIDTFLAYNKGKYGFHTIVEISNVVTDEVYLKQLPWSEQHKKGLEDPVIKAYIADREAAAQKWADLCGCSVTEAHSMPFSKMSKEAYAAYLAYDNVWRKYRPDVTDEYVED